MTPPTPQPSQRRWQPPAPAEMQRLLPQYEFVSLIGCGAMGAVYRANQPALNRAVAVKMMPGHGLEENAEANAAARFRQEAMTLAKLSHPGIVSVFDAGEVQGRLYIVMEFVDGTDVARLIRSEGKLSADAAGRLLMQVCDALHYAHDHGVVHRDVKPANLLLTRNGIVKIADFGIAKHTDAALHALTRSSLAVGTPDFLAPEAWIPDTSLDARADLYSLGVTLYQVLTGEVPRGLWKMPSVKAGVDPRFDAIIDRAMQPEREARYQSAAELRSDLERIVSEPSLPCPETARSPTTAAEPVLTPPPVSPSASTPQPRAASPPSRLWRWASASLVVLAIGILLVVGSRFPRNGSAGQGDESRVTPRAAALWLAREHADFKVQSEGREIEVKLERDIPSGEFQIVHLWFDRWFHGPPQPPPPTEEFEGLRTIHTLRYAFLRMPKLPTKAFGFLAENPNLHTLIIEAAPSTDDILLPLARLEHLKELNISDAHRLTGQNLRGAAWLPHIEHLDLLNSGLEDSAVATLTQCTQLMHLRVEGTPISHEGLSLLASLPRLRELLASGCSHLQEEDLIEQLPRFHRLKRLELQNSPYGDETAMAIASSLTNLTQLRLGNTRITDAGLARLATLPHLKTIRVVRTLVTPQGLDTFEQLQPDCEIER